MKIWFVVMLFGKVAMTVGPLPYGMEECHIRLIEQEAALTATFRTQMLANDPRMILDGQRIQRTDVTLKCVASINRPAHEY